jgi:enterochelin esterase-like enzyme
MKLAYTLAVACFGVIAFQARAQPPAATPAPAANAPPCGTFQSVETLADGRVTFRVCAPRATTITFRDDNSTAVTFAKAANGLWSGTSSRPVPADTYRYFFTIDGVRTVDPQATAFSENRSGSMGVYEVRGPAGAFQTFNPDIPHGAVARLDYWSKALGAQRRLHVYTPPGYETGRGRYPVFYLLHGAGDNDSAWTTAGHAHLILDNLIAAGKAKPMIVVMPAGHTPGVAGATGPGAASAADDFGRDFFTDVLPLVEKRYRTINNANNRAVAGLSMGGGHTINQVGLPHPEMFHYVGVFSMGLQPQAVAAYDQRLGSKLAQGSKELKLLWYGMGKEDFLYATVAPTRALWDKHGLKYVYRESEGGHTWMNWRAYLNEFVPLLFK